MGYAGGTIDRDYEAWKKMYEKSQDAAEGLNPIKNQEYIQRYKQEKNNRTKYALGDTASMAAGITGIPLRQNPAGVNEMDLRDTGGFIPPVGIKEKADDIPAMLSNNEFVFTADAVRGMGDGNVNTGAERMYALMKKLEKGGRV